MTIALALLRLIRLMRAAEAGKRLGRPARRDPGLAGAGWIIPVDRGTRRASTCFA